VLEGWNAVASKLEAQGEIVLGGHVRYFRHASPACADGPGAAGGAVHSLCEGAQIAEDTRRRPARQPHTGTNAMSSQRSDYRCPSKLALTFWTIVYIF